MKLIKPSWEIKEQESGTTGVYKQIEWAGRHCYKTENLIAENSAKGFVSKMVSNSHLAMCEHATIYLQFDVYHDIDDEVAFEKQYELKNKYKFNKYSVVKLIPHEDVNSDTVYVTTNYRVLLENNWLDDLKYLCEPTEHHEKRITVKFVCDRGILAEFTRHRVFSFAAESSRYCNYQLDKFGNEITFIIPCWLDISEGSYIYDIDSDENGLWWGWKDGIQNIHIPQEWNKTTLSDRQLFISFLCSSEDQYFKLLKQGWKPQQARNVLPLATKCDLIMTGFVNDWKHFFDLRALGTTGTPHPQAKELAESLMNEFKSRNLIN